MWFTRMIELINSWGLLRLHLCRALLSSCFKGYKYWQFLYFELLPYIKRNHKEYLETCKHWEKQSTSFIHRQVRMMNALSRPLSRRPVTHSCPGSLLDRGLHLVMHVRVGLPMREETLRDPRFLFVSLWERWMAST